MNDRTEAEWAADATLAGERSETRAAEFAREVRGIGQHEVEHRLELLESCAGQSGRWNTFEPATATTAGRRSSWVLGMTRWTC